MGVYLECFYCKMILARSAHVFSKISCLIRSPLLVQNKSKFNFCTNVQSKINMPLLGDIVPNFTAETNQGKIDFHSWLADSWAILFSHPADFTPVCTTELGRVQKLVPEFKKRGFKLAALSCDDVESHKGWIADIKAYNKLDSFDYPIIADPNRTIANTYGMMDPDELDSKGMPLTCRAVFIIGPDKKLKLSILYPAT